MDCVNYFYCIFNEAMDDVWKCHNKYMITLNINNNQKWKSLNSSQNIE